MISFTCPYCGRAERLAPEAMDAYLREHYDPRSRRRCDGRTYPRD